MGDLFINVLKVVFSFVLAPLIFAAIFAFQTALDRYPGNAADFFYYGMLAFVLVYFFLHRFWIIFEFGQKIVRGSFGYLAPFDKAVSYIFPFYSILIAIAMFIIKWLLNTSKYDHNFVFFLGFTFTMHILLTARSLQQQETQAVKLTYFWWMIVSFILGIFIIVLSFDFAFGSLTFPAFFQDFASIGQGYYIRVFHMFERLGLHR